MRKNIVVFSSFGPGNFQTVIDYCHINKNYHIIGLITDRDHIPSINLALMHKIEYKVFTLSPSISQLNVNLRSQECLPIYSHLKDLESNHGRIDLIVLGFRKLLKGKIIEEYQGRIINVHPADLSLHCINTRQRRYTGLNGLKRSICDGNKHTRTTIHYVDNNVDTGEIICLGPFLEFTGNKDNDADILQHERLQKQISDRPALTTAINLFFKTKSP